MKCKLYFVTAPKGLLALFGLVALPDLDEHRKSE